MQRLRPISILLCCLTWTASAAAQTSPTPPAAEPARPAAAPKAKPPAVAKKPPAAKPEATPAPAATVTPAPAPDDPNVYLVYGAYQRGMYKTSFDLASQRAATGDPKAMT